MRAAWALIAGCMFVALAAEGATRFGFNRVSRIQQRFLTEYALAQTFGVDGCGRPHALAVGNSLLLEGVEFERLRTSLAGRASSSPSARRCCPSSTSRASPCRSSAA